MSDEHGPAEQEPEAATGGDLPPPPPPPPPDPATVLPPPSDPSVLPPRNPWSVAGIVLALVLVFAGLAVVGMVVAFFVVLSNVGSSK